MSYFTPETYETFSCHEDYAMRGARCGACKKRTDEDLTYSSRYDCDVCETCYSDDLDAPEAPEVPLCPVERQIVEGAQTVAEMVDAMKAHQGAYCVHCASTRRTVQGDRELRSGAVCCDTEVA